MGKARLRILYSGRIQGVGFRYNAKAVSRGYDVLGTVRNLSDGTVELVVEGEREELEAFKQAVRESGVGTLVHNEKVYWETAEQKFRGFEIIS